MIRWLKSLVDKVFWPRRARKGARRVGDPYRIPCRVRKEGWTEPRRGAEGSCAPSPKHGIVPNIIAT